MLGMLAIAELNREFERRNMLLKGFKTKFIISLMVTLLLWGLCMLLSIGYEEGTDSSSLGRFCYGVCDLLTFSRPLFDWLDFGGLSMLLPLIITAILLSVAMQAVHQIIHAISKGSQRKR